MSNTMTPQRSFTLDMSRPRALINAEEVTTAALLQYQYTDTGEQVLVPNVWNNQMPEHRALHQRAMAARKRTEAYEAAHNARLSSSERIKWATHLLEIAVGMEDNAQAQIALAEHEQQPQHTCGLPPSDPTNLPRTRQAYADYLHDRQTREHMIRNPSSITEIEQWEALECSARHALQAAFFLDTSEFNTRTMCADVSPNQMAQMLESRDSVKAHHEYRERMRG